MRVNKIAFTKFFRSSMKLFLTLQCYTMCTSTDIIESAVMGLENRELIERIEYGDRWFHNFDSPNLRRALTFAPAYSFNLMHYALQAQTSRLRRH